MKLYGVYLSPYTRRVAIALNILDMPFEHDGLRIFETPEPVRAHNPLVRVPTLVMDDGSSLVESWAILDELDRLAGPERALAPAAGTKRREVMQIAAYGVGVMEKAQWAFYERRFHPEEKVHEPWEAHNDAQVVAGLKHLDSIAASAGDGCLAGTDSVSHADIAAAVAHSFVRAVRPKLDADTIAPALSAFTARCEALPAFKACPLP